ncbi:MAG: putative glycoside hydrolase family 15 protein [Gemmatimonadales bacterium]|nr:putative glycoside hydrolase family 15 protein [Gemmatimonadales bacterium]
MGGNYRALSVLFAGLVIWVGCSVSENQQSPEMRGPIELSVLEHSWPAMAVVDWGSIDFSDPANLQKFAKADILILETAYLWKEGRDSGAIAGLKALNPDIKILGYINAHGSWESWGEVDRSEAEYPSYMWDWYAKTRDFWSYTTTGDTMMSWPGKILLDFLNPDCRAAMVQVLSDHWYAHENVLDGIFWDHFNSYLWVMPNISGVVGEMDLDGDGISHREDEDEMQAYRDASVDLISRTRRALGGDVIQIANGQRAPADSIFAGLLDGMFYEDFPEYNYSDQKMCKALDPSVFNNLFSAKNWPSTQNGGPWLILSNPRCLTATNDDGEYLIWKRAEFNRVVGLLSGCLPVYCPQNQRNRYGWPEIEVELGLPLSGAVIDGDLVSREFELGRVVLDFSEATAMAPFGFVIEKQGIVQQQFGMKDYLP